MKRSLIITGSCALFFVLWYNRTLIGHLDIEFIRHSQSLHYALNYLLAGIVLLPALWMLSKQHNLFRSLGFSGSFVHGALFGIVAALPMLAGYAILGHWSAPTVDHMVCRIVLSGLFEEVVFRGIVFGLLFRYCGWGFLPAALFTALLFSAMHLWQGHGMAMALASFGTTAMTGLFFSWIYAEWSYNIWYPIWLHMLMNVPWVLFPVTDNPAGGTAVGIARTCTIVLAIWLTAHHKKKCGLPYCITLKNLFRNTIEA